MGFLDRVPLRIRDTTLIAAPGFHAWGAAHLAAGLMLGSTVVLQRRFDPEAVLAGIDMHRVRMLAVVPVMLQRILELPEDVRAKYDTSSLEVVASSGSRVARSARATLDGRVRRQPLQHVRLDRSVDRDGRRPAQLRATPGTAGTPLRGSTIKLLDEKGHEVPAGESGPHLRRQRRAVRAATPAAATRKWSTD